MMYTYLDIVEQFHCRQCGTCCRNDWLVTVGKTAYQRNRQLFEKQGWRAEFSQAFRLLTGRHEPGEYAYIAKRTAGGCWFLESDNLCRLHRVAGHAHLDEVCQVFPRYPMNTARGIDLTVSFSCPVVLDLATRREPLRILRSDKPPIDFFPDAYVEQVFPRQQSYSQPLRYYFELEQHFIDIMQFRPMTIPERLDMLCFTIRQIGALAGTEHIGRALNGILNEGYERLDAYKSTYQPDDAAILTEHYLVHCIFKKLFYNYGLERALAMLDGFYQAIAAKVRAAAAVSERLSYAKKAVMGLEFQYGHQRESLLLQGK